ncbi:uncharacterized protein LOC127135821 [Lathyrus oleraceus]|uniref:uncharacterized protein LOC127135821 n=1 Tax=Pisum sativum TaxID=3888 RepID=UPI0021D236BF|nr:uncharacterized protein LOC127135821 [Pisum sativum]
MATVSNDRIPTNLPILDSKNYDKWAKQMRVLFGYQEVLEIVVNGVTQLGAEATDIQRATHKEEKKKDYKTLFLIHSCVDNDNFEKVGDCESAKQAWEILEKAYDGAVKAKVVRLQTYKRQFELTQMEDKETINDYITCITRLVNQIKSCGETILEQNVVLKVWCSLTPRFDNIVVAIEESKDLTTLSKDELQISLEAHEQRMDERGADKSKAEIALQARFNEKNKRSKGICGERKFGHFANSCRGKLNENHNNEAKVAREEVDDEDTLLVIITEGSYNITDVPGSNYCSDSLRDSSCTIPENSEKMHSDRNALVTVRDGVQGRDEWYLDSGCSTHMTGRKDWFVKINQAAKSKVKFADDTILSAEGVGDVLIGKRNDGHSRIKDVLYIPGIECNLLSIDQLLERGYKIRLEDKILCVLDSNGVLILKVPMAANRTFKVELKVIEHRCLATTASRDEWL